MHMRPLGKTGLRVAELALGTWGLSGDGYGPVDEATQQKVVERAIEMGVSLIDTADAYGGGRMEQLLGRILADRRDVVVVTKGGTDRTTAPPRKRFDGPYIKESVEKSLRRLARRRVDVYLLHNPSVSALEGGDAVDTLTALKAEGKVGHWGVSVGDVETGRAAIRCGAEILELAYNLMHASDMHRLAGDIVVSARARATRASTSSTCAPNGISPCASICSSSAAAARVSPAMNVDVCHPLYANITGTSESPIATSVLKSAGSSGAPWPDAACAAKSPTTITAPIATILASMKPLCVVVLSRTPKQLTTVNTPSTTTATIVACTALSVMPVIAGR